ncbi:MAG: Holliday junction resolvase RuvX [Candidatus Pacebacteria bacterium]|nr:Holliday junction resolvase RuvX [Candidatus Paceibacterota bacterium]
MRILGIDYGTKRIGIALSDESGVLAFPKEIILNDVNTWKKIEKILKSEDVGEVVIGESLNLDGKPNILLARIEIFIQEFKNRFSLPVHKQKEFLTSIEARKSKIGKQDRDKSQASSKVKKVNTTNMDASAAALILQRYLDKKNKQVLN